MQEQIIHFLKNADGYISGEEISRQLKISRAGIWKYMQELRKSGYDIVAVPHLGYRLLHVPDKLLASEIQYGLATKKLGQIIDYYELRPRYALVIAPHFSAAGIQDTYHLFFRAL
jgi:BirA family biotin operon repressor/biotin-[acetyl-CoA-carboxylase] ligase